MIRMHYTALMVAAAAAASLVTAPAALTDTTPIIRPCFSLYRERRPRKRAIR